MALTGKFVGFERVQGKAKATGNSFDIVKLYCVGSTSPSVVGQSVVTITVNTPDLSRAVGVDLAALSTVLNSSVTFDFGFGRFGQAEVTGFTLPPKHDEPVRK